MPVLIAGAGPAGAATALLLARAGVEVDLYEREVDFARVFRGEGLMPSGVDALHEMGLADLLESLPCRRLASWDICVDGREIFSVPESLEDLGERAVRVVPQPQLLAALIAEAGKHPGFRFHPGSGVRGLVRERGRVVGLRVRSGNGEATVRGELVLGCDGRGSLVRKRANLPLEQLREHYDVAWFKLPAPPRLQDRSVMKLMATLASQAACYTSWDGRLQFALVIPKGGFAARREAEPKNRDWIEAMAQPCPDWLAAHIRSVAAEVEGPVLLDVMVGRCPAWSAPGVLLLGDAAHPMSPVRAQGINLALRDAIVAANHLVRALPVGREAIEVAGLAIQREREPEIVRSQTLQHRDVAGLDSVAAPLLFWLAKHVGGAIGRTTWAQRAWLRQQRDLRFGSTDVRLRV